MTSQRFARMIPGMRPGVSAPVRQDPPKSRDVTVIYCDRCRTKSSSTVWSQTCFSCFTFVCWTMLDPFKVRKPHGTRWKYETSCRLLLPVPSPNLPPSFHLETFHSPLFWHVLFGFKEKIVDKARRGGSRRRLSVDSVGRGLRGLQSEVQRDEVGRVRNSSKDAWIWGAQHFSLYKLAC